MICVDASVAAKWVLAEEHSDKALALFYDSAVHGDPVIAPPLLPVEVANIIRQRVRRGLLAAADADKILARFLAFPLTLTSSGSPHASALNLSSQHELHAVYDAYYLALAREVGATLWTADRRLYRAVETRLSFVRLIGEYTPEDHGD